MNAIEIRQPCALLMGKRERETFVYILQQTARVDQNEAVKNFGIYSKKQHSEAAIERVREKPDFRNPDGEFSNGPYELDKDYWADGFGIDF